MKLIEKIKKHDNIVVLLIISVTICAMVFFSPIINGDEMWTFSNMYKMSNGYTIYKDINVIQTPLFFCIGAIIFKIFGANYLVYRIYQALIHIFMWFAVYKLLKTLKIRKLNCILYLVGMMLVYKNMMIGTASYNTLAVTFYLMGIILLIEEKFKPKVNAMIQGIIIFLIFLSKQNIAVYYIIATIIYKLVVNKNIKETIKLTCIELFTMAVLVCIFLFTLYLGNNLYNFINYTVLGISEFAEQNIAFTNIYVVPVQIALLIAYIVIASIKKLPFENNIRKNIKMLSIFSILLTFVGYPIFNVYHVYMGLILTIIITLYIINKLIFETLLETKKADKIKKVIISLIMVYFICIFVINNIAYIQNMYKEGPYFGAILREETVEEISKMVNFIKEENNNGVEIKILSSYSNMYMVLLNKNNGVMDLIFNGNMGKDGADGVIKQIQNSKNTKYLINKDEKDLIQESQKIREYVQNNLTKIGEITRFDIYE